MVLCFIEKQRGHTQEKRASVNVPVIDICRPAPSNVDQDSYMAEPQRPRLAYLSSETPTLKIPPFPADCTLPKFGNPLPLSG
jgi:hypothetical protein